MVLQFGWRGLGSLMPSSKCGEFRHGGVCGRSESRGNFLGAD